MGSSELIASQLKLTGCANYHIQVSLVEVTQKAFRFSPEGVANAIVNAAEFNGAADMDRL